MRRTWFQPSSGSPPFRNCSLIEDDMRRLVNRAPWRRRALREERDRTWQKGAMSAVKGNPAGPGPRDRLIPYDDSPEATDRWVRRFLDSNGKDVSG